MVSRLSWLNEVKQEMAHGLFSRFLLGKRQLCLLGESQFLWSPSQLSESKFQDLIEGRDVLLLVQYFHFQCFTNLIFQCF